MKILIAGSREITDYEMLDRTIEQWKKWGYVPTEVVSGGARGVDALGELWAAKHGVPVKRFLPDWNKYGKQAGFLRNGEMVAYCEAAVILWDGKSKGTKHTIDLLIKQGKPYIQRGAFNINQGRPSGLYH